MRPLTKERFSALSKEKHGADRYGYDAVVMLGSKRKVQLLCNVCRATFWVTPNNHLNPANLTGCPACHVGPKPPVRIRGRPRARRTMTFEVFTLRAAKTHPNAYLYDPTTFVSATKPTSIFCRRCERWFEQRPSHHLAGQRCGACYGRCYVSRGETTWLDSLGIAREDRNVWLTLPSKRRVNVDALVGHVVYEFYGTNVHADPRVHSPDKFNALHRKTMGEVHQATLDRERELENAGFTLVTMWELDWETQDGSFASP